MHPGRLPLAGEGAPHPVRGELLAFRDGELGGELRSRQGGFGHSAASAGGRGAARLKPYDLRRGRGEDRELCFAHPRLGVRGERKRHVVELGDGVEHGARVHVVREQAGGGAEDSRRELAQGELSQLPYEHGDSERRKSRGQQGDPVALQHGAYGVQPVQKRLVQRRGMDHDEMAVLFEQELRLRERGVERHLLGRLEDMGPGGVPVVRGQHVIVAGDC